MRQYVAMRKRGGGNPNRGISENSPIKIVMLQCLECQFFIAFYQYEFIQIPPNVLSVPTSYEYIISAMYYQIIEITGQHHGFSRFHGIHIDRTCGNSFARKEKRTVGTPG